MYVGNKGNEGSLKSDNFHLPFYFHSNAEWQAQSQAICEAARLGSAGMGLLGRKACLHLFSPKISLSWSLRGHRALKTIDTWNDANTGL